MPLHSNMNAKSWLNEDFMIGAYFTSEPELLKINSTVGLVYGYIVVKD